MESNKQPFPSKMTQPTGSDKTRPMNSEDTFSDRSGGSRSSATKVRRQDEIFQEYYQIGSELKHSLKAFESNNLYLSNKLSRLHHEIDVLKRHREIQKNTLVELQIRTEKLDQLKQTTIKECLLDKNQKLEVLNKDLGGILEEDQYLTETQDKIQNLLENDKSEVAEFRDNLRQELANQVKFSDEYKKNTERMFNICYQRVKNAIEEEKNVDLELEEAMKQCKNRSGLKEKYEYELQEKFTNLELIENEVEMLKIRLRSCEEELNVVLVENNKMNDQVVKTRAAFSNERSEKKKLVEGLEKEIADKTTDLVESEMKLKEAMQTNKYLSEQVEKALNQVQVTSTDIGELNGQIDELNKKIAEKEFKLKELEDEMFELSGVHKLEDRISTRKRAVVEKLAAENSMVTELENKLSGLQNEWAKTKRKQEELKRSEEELKRRNESAKKEIDGLLEGLGEMKEDAKLKELKEELSELKSRNQVLKLEIDDVQKRLKSTTAEMANLKDENAALDQELKEVSTKEELATKKFEYFQNERARLDEMKSKISLVKEEVLKIKTCREFSVDVEHLTEEVQKVQREIELKKQQYASQKQSIQDSFKKTLKSLQGQMEKLKEASEEEMRKRKSRTDGLHDSGNQLRKEIQTCKDDLRRTTRKNIAMMRERLMVTDRLVESYRMLQAQSESANGKDFTVIRLLGTIEEHLSSSFRGMIEYLRMGPVDLSSPSYFVYKRTLENFERRFQLMTSEGDERLTDPDYLAELKMAAFCLFGLRRYSAPSSASDSTMFSPASSSVRDF